MNTVLYTVTAAGTRHARAVGTASPRQGSPNPQEPVVEAWDGSAWQPACLPPAIQLHLGGILNTVTATVTSGQPSVWAITMDGAGRTMTAPPGLPAISAAAGTSS